MVPRCVSYVGRGARTRQDAKAGRSSHVVPVIRVGRMQRVGLVALVGTLTLMGVAEPCARPSGCRRKPFQQCH